MIKILWALVFRVRFLSLTELTEHHQPLLISFHFQGKQMKVDRVKEEELKVDRIVGVTESGGERMFLVSLSLGV